MNAPPPLGRSMHFHGFSLAGMLSLERWESLLNDVTNALEMKPAGIPAVWNYPMTCGAGGNGSTMIQPITESFVALDTWPDHNGAYLLVCSCRNFRADAVMRVLSTYKLRVNGEVGHVL